MACASPSQYSRSTTPLPSFRGLFRSLRKSFAHLTGSILFRLLCIFVFVTSSVLTSWLGLTVQTAAAAADKLASVVTTPQKASASTPAATPAQPVSTSASKSSAAHPHTAAGVKPLVDASNSLDGLGDQPFYTYTSLPLTKTLGLKVNVADGNLLLESSDYTLHGTGLDLDLSSYYNSLHDFNFYEYEHGDNWTSDLCGTQYLDESTPTSDVIFYGPSNTSAYFPYKGAGPNNTLLYTDAPGLNASVVGNADDTYTLTYHKTGEKVTFGQYTSVDKIQDRNNNTISCAYSIGADGTQHTASITDTQGRVITPTLDDSDHITALTDQSGRSVRYGYDDNNHLTSITDRNGKKTTYGYTGDLLTSITDPLSNVTRIQYLSGTNQVSKITAADTGTLQYTYYESTDSACSGIEPAGQTVLPCTVVTDQNGHSTTYLYNNQWQVTYTKDALGHISSQAFDVANYNVTQYGDALSNFSNFVFSTDGRNNLTSSVDGSGATTTFGYPAAGSSTQYDPLSQTDPQGNKTDYAYDSNGNLSSATDDKSGKGLTYAYNSNGTVASQKDADATGSNGHMTTYGYDSKGNLKTITQPSPLGATTLTYDSLSRVTSVTDGNNHKTSYTYDALDHVSKITYADASTVSYTYDANGNVLKETDHTGSTSFQYDALNRIKLKTLPGGTTITTTYDKIGNLTSLTDTSGKITYAYDATNRMTTLTDANGLQTAYGYDNANRKTSIVYPNNTGQLMTYDGAGHTTSVVGGKITMVGTQPTVSTQYTNFQYTYTVGTTGTDLLQSNDAFDPVSQSVTYDWHYIYDSQNRITQVNKDYHGGTTLASDWTYGYDANNNLTSATYAGFSKYSYNYSYNGANELTGSSGSYTNTPGNITTNFTLTYGYDGNGNETSVNNSNTYNTPPNITDQTQTLSYNTANQQTGGTVVSNNYSYGYSGTDQTDRVSNNGATDVYTGLGVSSEKNASGTTEYVRCSCGLLNSMHTPNGQKYYYLFDGEGSIVVVTDSTGAAVDRYAYNAYGFVIAQQVQSGLNNPWMYAGGYYDSVTGLYKFGIRYYDPTIGRWTQRTPVGGSLQETTKANPYVYADDNPLNEVDPSGRSVISCIFGSILGIGLGIAETALFLGTVVAGATLIATLTVGATAVGGPILGGLAGVGLSLLGASFVSYEAYQLGSGFQTDFNVARFICNW